MDRTLGAPHARLYKFTNFGNEVVVPKPQIPAGVSPIDFLKDRSNVLPSRLVVEANLLEEAPAQAANFWAGNWVVAMSANTRNDEDNIVPGLRYINPVVVRMLVGSGGTAHEVIIDGWDQSINVPAGVARVEVGYTHLPEDFNPDPVAVFALPTETRFRATIQRGYSQSAATLKRPVATFGGGTIQGIVPNFATCWRPIFPFGIDTIGAVRIYGAGEPQGGAFGELLDLVDASVVQEMNRVNASRRLPAGAEYFETDNTDFSQGNIQFEIGGLG